MKRARRNDKTCSIAHDYARIQEQNTAKEYGGYTTPKSGAGDIKGDVRVKGKYRIECKCTIKKSYALNKEYLRKFTEQAAALAEDPIMQLHFIDEHGHKEDGYIIMPENFIKDYLING